MIISIVFFIIISAGGLDGFSTKYWWKYAIISIFFIISIVLLLFANVESVKFDKLHDDFVWQKTNTFCITQTYNFYISDITDIKIIKAGVKSSITDTIHYMVKIELNDDTIPITPRPTASTGNRRSASTRSPIGSICRRACSIR